MDRYIKSLDGLRGMAILIVMIYHYLRLVGFDPSVMGFSWVAIQMFFVQSGFLITRILLASKEQGFKMYARDFYWKRILRILPVYILYISIFFLLYLILAQPADFMKRILYLLTFTYNYTRLISDLNFNSIWFIHFWSLAVEEQFYLIWPLGVYFLSKKQMRWLIVIVITLTPAFRYFFVNLLIYMGYSSEMTGEITYAFTLSQLDSFALGAAIPLFDLQKKIVTPGKWAIVLLFITLTAGFINYNILQDIYPDYSLTSFGLSVGSIENYQHVWSYTLVNFFFLFLILYLIQEDYKGLFNKRVLTSSGKIVYGMYIFHFAVIYLLYFLNERVIHNHLISFTISLLLCYGISFISYHYFEKQFLKLRSYWSK